MPCYGGPTAARAHRGFGGDPEGTSILVLKNLAAADTRIALVQIWDARALALAAVSAGKASAEDAGADIVALGELHTGSSDTRVTCLAASRSAEEGIVAVEEVMAEHSRRTPTKKTASVADGGGNSTKGKTTGKGKGKGKSKDKSQSKRTPKEKTATKRTKKSTGKPAKRRRSGA